jgi:hypothetical protein
MSIWNFNKIRHNICKVILPKDSKIVKKEEVTVNELMDDHVQKLEQLPGVFSKDFLEKLIKEYPQMDHPNIIESDGKIKFTDANGKTAQLKVPLLTIVPIPYISKDSIDLDKYYKENFGESNPPKNMEDIKGVQVNVPALNIVPIPAIPIKEENKKED